MSVGWRRQKLGDILALEYGKPLPSSRRKADGLYPVYGANGEKDRSDEFYHDRPSIVVGRKGSAGEVNMTEERFWPLDVTYFVTFDDTEHDLRFLFYLLKGLDLPSLAKGVKPGINRNEVYGLTVEVPLLSEQQQIAQTLDQAYSGIAVIRENAERKAAALNELESALLRQALSGGSSEIRL